MIIDDLKTALANHIESSLIVQGYHWNVTGIDFNQYHDFFSCIYSDYYSQVDSLAEYIRIVSDASEYVNASVDVIKTNKTVQSELIVGPKPVDMCKAIIKLNNVLIGNYQTLFDSASKENIQGLADYCASRLDTLNKLNWKLISITK